MDDVRVAHGKPIRKKVYDAWIKGHRKSWGGGGNDKRIGQSGGSCMTH